MRALLLLVALACGGCGVQTAYIDSYSLGFDDPFFVIDRSFPVKQVEHDGERLLAIPFHLVLADRARDIGEIGVRISTLDREQGATPVDPASYGLVSADGEAPAGEDKRDYLGVQQQAPPPPGQGPGGGPLRVGDAEDGTTSLNLRIVLREAEFFRTGQRYRVELCEGACDGALPKDIVEYELYVTQSYVLVSVASGLGAVLGFTLLGSLAE